MESNVLREEFENIAESACLICGGKLTSTGKKARDREDAHVVTCKQCGHVQIFPVLTPEEEKEELDNVKAARFGKVKVADGSDFETMRVKYSEWTKEHVNLYFDILQNFKEVLDLGAGYGFFVQELNNCPERKFNIEGIEIGKFRLDNFVGGVAHNINILTDDIPDNLRHKYDCIISMHVFEHISKPIMFLERMKPLLKPGGKAIFEVPNINCFLREIAPEYEKYFYLYEHCSYYSEDTLRLVFEKAGYIVESIKTYEIYSIENHCHWIREGVPFTKYHQMFMPEEKLEWINKIYKEEISRQGKGYSLTIQARL